MNRDKEYSVFQNLSYCVRVTRQKHPLLLVYCALMILINAGMADLIEVPAIALLVVSDNSATGAALVGRTDEEQARYNNGRQILLPKMVLAVAGMQ